MKTLRRSALIIALFVAGVLLLLAATRGYQILHVLQFDSLCGVELAGEASSPNGKMRAVIYQRSCGATTPFTTQVSLLESFESVPGEPGNVFSAFGGSKRGEWGGPYAEIQWLGDDLLEIRHIADAQVTQRIEQREAISIRHVEMK